MAAATSIERGGRKLTEEGRKLAGDPSNIAHARMLATKMSRKVPRLREEYISVAFEALCIAAITFDPAICPNFPAYATRRIRWEILKYAEAELGRADCSLDSGDGPGSGGDRGSPVVPSGDGPIGWEIESADEVDAILSRIPGSLRQWVAPGFRDCWAVSRHAIAERRGCSVGHASRMARHAIEALRPEPTPAGRKRTRASSQYLGVSRRARDGKWVASATIDGKEVELGRFATEREAAVARDRAVIAHGLAGKSNGRGRRVLLNFPDMEAVPA